MNDEGKILTPELLEKKLGYVFNDPRLLKQALTHRSVINERQEKQLQDNERLEFIGDAVLSLAIATLLAREYPHLREGVLSKMRSGLVNEITLAEIAAHMDLGLYVVLGRGEEKTGGRNRKSLLSDCLEAIIGAVYLDGSFTKALEVVERLFYGKIASSGKAPFQDAKSCLQEVCQREFGGLPVYELMDEWGREHDKTYVIGVSLSGRLLAVHRGSSKKEAEQKAAELALLELAK
jgi:ribonuclease-3